MRPVWEKVAAWCIERKPRIKLLWDDADTQKNGLMNDGVIVGQTWDGPPLALKTAGEPVMYRAPKEGAMAWVDGLSIPSGAKNLDEAYAFIDFAYQAEPAGKAIDTHG
jgi:spermidine/putrescine transport system substrate-binding protein